MKHSNHKKGYTLLFAVLLSSLVLSISVSILTISRKELILSASARESQMSFFAADAGIECALYYNNLGQFNIENLDGSVSPNFSNFSCNNTDADDMQASYNGSGYFYFEFALDQKQTTDPCAKVGVWKEYYDHDEDSLTPEVIKTTIESRGYNTCVTLNPRRTERAIRVTM